MKKIIRCSAILLTFLVLAAAYSVRVWQVNAQYPAPEVLTYKIGETAVHKNMEITVTDVYFSEDPVLLERITEGSDVPVCLVAEVTTKNIGDEPASANVVFYEFQCGATRNATHYSAYLYMNDMSNSSPLKPGESRSVKLPVAMFEYNFTKAQWQNISPDDFQMVVSFYPVKIVFDF